MKRLRPLDHCMLTRAGVFLLVGQSRRIMNRDSRSVRKGWHVAKRSLISTVALVFVASLAVSGQSKNLSPGSWTGVIINGNCGVDQAFAELAECTKKGVPGARLALYDDTVRQVYMLDPQDQAVGHEGDSVTVSGAVEDDRIHVTSLQLTTTFGLRVGERAPAFSARDQFGREQTLDTLKGPNGTVLLFFRSADW
jgi:hypothetical protein